jgi:UDP-4-amino-4,6-dideoxy-N-acetyl-beta-L-altrosamine transaminase
LIPYSCQTVSFFDAIKVGWQVWQKSLTQGPRILEFESAVASQVHARYAVAVSSATAGLHIALLALEIDRSSDVVTSPISFLASSNAALYCDLNPRFVDIDPNSINLDLNEVSTLIKNNPKIKAIIPVHFAGLPCDMSRLNDIAKERSIYIVEDAAHALGATYACGSKVGSCKYSDLTVFSFHPVKSVTTGEGGVITTNNFDLYQRLLQLRSHGINQNKDQYLNSVLSKTLGSPNPWYYEMQRLGYHYRLTEFQAVLGISQIKKLNRFISSRQNAAEYYDRLFAKSKIVKPAQTDPKKNSARHLYVIRIDFTALNISRFELMAKLKEKNIGTQVHYRPIPQQPYYESLGYRVEDYPQSLIYFEEALSIPLYPKLTRRKQRYVAGVLLKLIEDHLVSEPIHSGSKEND